MYINLYNNLEKHYHLVVFVVVVVAVVALPVVGAAPFSLCICVVVVGFALFYIDCQV